MALVQVSSRAWVNVRDVSAVTETGRDRGSKEVWVVLTSGERVYVGYEPHHAHELLQRTVERLAAAGRKLELEEADDA